MASEEITLGNLQPAPGSRKKRLRVGRVGHAAVEQELGDEAADLQPFGHLFGFRFGPGFEHHHRFFEGGVRVGDRA